LAEHPVLTRKVRGFDAHRSYHAGECSKAGENRSKRFWVGSIPTVRATQKGEGMSSVLDTKRKVKERFGLSDSQLETYWQKAWREASGGHNREPKVEAVRAVCIRIAQKKVKV
jgi:hypothetical protein